jgi:peptidoglycan/LPS O-acetylase OafA/YrhL
VVVHGLLLQNLFPAISPNRALWSIAIEAQLYIALPVMLFVVRRTGALAMIGAVLVAMVGIGALASPEFLANGAPDLGGLFAVGVVAAGIMAASRTPSGERRASWPWHWLALATGIPVLAVIIWKGSVWTLTNVFWVDLALGPAIGCVLAGVVTHRPAPLVRLLDSRPLRGLGSFSYSLYLTHAPIVVVIYHTLVAGRVTQGVPSLLVSLALVVPATIIFAWLFAAVFELPFQRHRGWRAWAHGWRR